jgi:rhodanese-related sulfurtransferase
MKALFYITIFLICTSGYSQIKSKPITEFSQKDIKNGILVDVRTPEEYAAGHLEGAINVNLFEEDFAARFDTVGKTKTLYLYCKKGGRSARAAGLLDSLGYQVMDLKGGYDALAPK